MNARTMFSLATLVTAGLTASAGARRHRPPASRRRPPSRRRRPCPRQRRRRRPCPRQHRRRRPCPRRHRRRRPCPRRHRRQGHAVAGAAGQVDISRRGPDHPGLACALRPGSAGPGLRTYQAGIPLVLIRPYICLRMLFILGLTVAAAAQTSSHEAPRDEETTTRLDMAYATTRAPRVLKPGDHGVGRLVADAAFTDIAGKTRRLSDFRGSTALVIVLTSTSCPLKQEVRADPGAARAGLPRREWPSCTSIRSPPTRARRSTRRLRLMACRGPMSTTARGTWSVPWGRMRPRMSSSSTRYGRSSITARSTISTAWTTRVRRPNTAIWPRRSRRSRAAGGRRSPRPRLGCALDRGAEGPSTAPLTYHNRVSRLLQSYCLECHHDKGSPRSRSRATTTWWPIAA